MPKQRPARRASIKYGGESNPPRTSTATAGRLSLLGSLAEDPDENEPHSAAGSTDTRSSSGFPGSGQGQQSRTSTVASWKAIVDEGTGATYYWNTVTGTTSWTLPTNAKRGGSILNTQGQRIEQKHEGHGDKGLDEYSTDRTNTDQRRAQL